MRESKIIYFTNTDEVAIKCDLEKLEKEGWEVIGHCTSVSGSGIASLICTSVLLQREKKVVKRTSRKKKEE